MPTNDCYFYTVFLFMVTFNSMYILLACWITCSFLFLLSCINVLFMIILKLFLVQIFNFDQILNKMCDDVFFYQFFLFSIIYSLAKTVQYVIFITHVKNIDNLKFILHLYLCKWTEYTKPGGSLWKGKWKIWEQHNWSHMCSP